MLCAGCPRPSRLAGWLRTQPERQLSSRNNTESQGGRERNDGADAKRAVLAGGCFWGVQDLLRRRRRRRDSGRIHRRWNDHPTYGNHPGTRRPPRSFRPRATAYREILELFFQIHDPSTKDRQGNDIGLSYRSEIY